MASANHTNTSIANWILAVDDIAIVVNVFGLIGNFIVFVTITRGGFRSKKTSAMIGHQSVVDLLVCLVSILKLANHDNLNYDAGNYTLNAIICFLWVDKLVYWYLVFTSVFCLVLLCVDRYLAVVKPLSYRKVDHRSYIGMIAVIHICALALNVVLLVDTVHFVDGRCKHDREDFGKTLGLYQVGTLRFQLVGVIWLTFLYFIPTVVFISMYTITLRAFNRSHFARTASEMRKKLSTQLTKSALVVTGLYLFSFSIDTVYFLLGFFDVIVLDDIKNPVNRVASLFVNFHSITPFIYCWVLRLFRERLIKTMTCGRVDKTQRITTYRETTD